MDFLKFSCCKDGELPPCLSRKRWHIITAERLPNGGLRVYDSQNGKIVQDFKAYAKRFLLKSGIRVLRVDELRINTSIISGVVRESTKK